MDAMPSLVSRPPPARAAPPYEEPEYTEEEEGEAAYEEGRDALPSLVRAPYEEEEGKEEEEDPLPSLARAPYGEDAADGKEEEAPYMEEAVCLPPPLPYEDGEDAASYEERAGMEVGVNAEDDASFPSSEREAPYD